MYLWKSHFPSVPSSLLCCFPLFICPAFVFCPFLVPPYKVTCHVTGFYPREVQVIWLGSDLQPVDEGVTEILPNDDGTYQTRKSVIVPEEDVGKQNYSCVVLHISIPNNITTVWGTIKYSTLNITRITLAVIKFTLVDCSGLLSCNTDVRSYLHLFT
uniref:Ig-like domain-containing protein n=1 Tax=Astyanax mexicanus TaxID=7994 RepID=A0A3B1ITK6_ASTMX